jgi:hypothetical protein
MPADNQKIQLTKLIFGIFQALSGLKLNLQKSIILVTANGYTKALELATIMHCQASQFPIQYLGLPLSNKKLAKEAYYDLIYQEERRLSGWKASTLSLGGRIILINAVLSAQPVYYMSIFRLPKWVISKLDKIRRRFLWHGHKESQEESKPIHLASWKLVTRNKQL